MLAVILFHVLIVVWCYFLCYMLVEILRSTESNTTLQLIHETRWQPARSTESNTTLQLIHETRWQPACSTESNTTLQLIHETRSQRFMY
jgi:ABC-type phosphate transport system permease subunit